MDEHPCRVLLIDDELAILRIYQRALANYGFVTETACVADQALEHLARTPFDVVICDVHMPGSSGLDLVQTIHRRHPLVQIIVISGKPTDAAQNHAMLEGAVRYLVKPVMPSVLRSVIEAAIRLRPSSGVHLACAVPAAYK